jgi:transposase
VREERVWARLLGVEQAVVDDVDLEQDAGQQMVVRVHVRRGHRNRCPHCQRRCGKFDDGGGPRRWRAPDVGVVKAFIEAEAPRC